MSDEDAIEAAALRLPRAERARLAERLIASLGPDPEAEAKWKTEVCRRVEELRSGAVASIPGEQVFREMDEMLR
jgi:putative addiction module component (TIGR02574 family)